MSTKAMAKGRKLRFGDVMGITVGGVPAFSSDYDSADDSTYRSRKDYVSFSADGTYCGFKYQCVEFARRWLISVYQITFPDVHMAYEIFELPCFHRVVPKSAAAGSDASDALGPSVPVLRCPNDVSAALPSTGAVIMWKSGGFFRFTGHVAIVTESSEDAPARAGAPSSTGWIRVAEQNVYDASWDGRDHSRELRAERLPSGGWRIHDNHSCTHVLGWLVPVLQEPVALVAAAGSSALSGSTVGAPHI